MGGAMKTTVNSIEETSGFSASPSGINLSTAQRWTPGLWYLALAFFAGISSGLKASPILLYDFNTPGAVQTSSGSDPLALTTRVGATSTDKVTTSPAGPDGSSVFGLAGSPQNTTLEGSVSGNANFTTGLASFTLTAWVQDFTHSSTGNERIFYLRGGSAVAIDWSLGASPVTGASQLFLAVNGSAVVSSYVSGTGTPFLLPNESSTWHFIAVTYDATDGGVVFYSAPLGGTLTSYTPTAKLTNTQVINSTALNIANIQATGGGRLLDANIDDIAFYGTALSAGEVNAIFTAIPEPATATATILGLLLIAGSRTLSRRMTRRNESLPSSAPY